MMIMVSTRRKTMSSALTRMHVATQTELPQNNAAIQVSGFRECQSLSLVTDGSSEKSCMRCDQVDDLLSLVAELWQEVERLRTIMESEKECFGFGCRRQQKHHAAAPPPAGVRRRMKRKRQKLVGRDKDSLTEQQTEGNRNNNDTDKEKTQQKQTRSLGPPWHRTLPSREWVPAAPPPHRNPAWHHMVWNTGLCLASWGEPPPPGCAPSWSPVKINPVLAKPSTKR